VSDRPDQKLTIRPAPPLLPAPVLLLLLLSDCMATKHTAIDYVINLRAFHGDCWQEPCGSHTNYV